MDSRPSHRAAHLRGNDELLALESHPASRAYVVHRDALVVKRENNGVRALLSIDEALQLGANHGTIFLGLRDGALGDGAGLRFGHPAVRCGAA